MPLEHDPPVPIVSRHFRSPPSLETFLALGHAFALLAMLALLQRVTSALGQPDEVAEKWTAELSNALVTAPDDAALLLQHDSDDRSSSRGLSTTGGWRDVVGCLSAAGVNSKAFAMFEAKLIKELDALAAPKPPTNADPRTPPPAEPISTLVNTQ